jgi:hypothetical protein
MTRRNKFDWSNLRPKNRSIAWQCLFGANGHAKVVKRSVKVEKWGILRQNLNRNCHEMCYWHIYKRCCYGEMCVSTPVLCIEEHSSIYIAHGVFSAAMSLCLRVQVNCCPYALRRVSTFRVDAQLCVCGTTPYDHLWVAWMPKCARNSCVLFLMTNAAPVKGMTLLSVSCVLRRFTFGPPLILREFSARMCCCNSCASRRRRPQP